LKEERTERKRRLTQLVLRLIWLGEELLQGIGGGKSQKEWLWLRKGVLSATCRSVKLQRRKTFGFRGKPKGTDILHPIRKRWKGGNAPRMPCGKSFHKKKDPRRSRQTGATWVLGLWGESSGGYSFDDQAVKHNIGIRVGSAEV